MNNFISREVDQFDTKFFPPIVIVRWPLKFDCEYVRTGGEIGLTPGRHFAFVIWPMVLVEDDIICFQSLWLHFSKCSDTTMHDWQEAQAVAAILQNIKSASQRRLSDLRNMYVSWKSKLGTETLSYSDNWVFWICFLKLRSSWLYIL
jgi:hypothetical protein